MKTTKYINLIKQAIAILDDIANKAVQLRQAHQIAQRQIGQEIK